MISEHAKVGIVTVTYNSAEVLEDFLDSLVAQVGANLHVYIVDNASADRTLEIVEQYDGKLPITTIANSENTGIAVGNNQGTEQAIADGVDWILFHNNDTILPPDAVATLVQVASANSIDLLSPLIEATDPPGSVWYAGGDINRALGMKPTHSSAGGAIADVHIELMPVGYASTCSLLVNPRVLHDIGLMDPVYFVYYDDIDFAVRVVDAGYQFWLTPATTVIHKASSLTGGPDSPFFIRWRSRNWVLIARKYTPRAKRWMPLLYIQAWALARLVLRRDSWTAWKLRQKSFREGMRVPTDTVAPRLPARPNPE
ncbi:glycosyltransferase family 2 protein [Microbacterium sp. CJ77]|uniref:glycosyltransferase family 2 protein n=1 Tax=Microbacterium sp. CJ77 TaxID=2079201 RepID=UPI000CD8F0A5|nr:glycosyltransferase family 2 protein [Microbacterium sp. CJ77]